MATKNESPMMKQFREMKAKHPYALLLFRCGDFYEAYCEDAKECAKILGITLTYRNTDKMPMTGFPYHALDPYLPKLVRAGKRVAICDQLEDPNTKKLVKRGITELVSSNDNENQNENENENQETMATNVKAADLIGKVLVLGDGSSKYVIKSNDGDKLQCDFIRGESAPISVSVTMQQIDAMVSSGKAAWESDAPKATATDEVEEVTDVQPQPAKAKPRAKANKTNGQPAVNGQSSARPKDACKARTVNGQLSYSTYTNKKGKRCARIVGFSEGDAILERENAERIHASSTYERDKKGNKHYMLIFGPRYADAAKDVCKAMNAGKTLAGCQAIIDKATEERAQQRDEWKQKREEHKAQTSTTGYSAEDVAAMLRKVMAGGDIPEDIKKVMAV